MAYFFLFFLPQTANDSILDETTIADTDEMPIEMVTNVSSV